MTNCCRGSTQTLRLNIVKGLDQNSGVFVFDGYPEIAGNILFLCVDMHMGYKSQNSFLGQGRFFFVFWGVIFYIVFKGAEYLKHVWNISKQIKVTIKNCIITLFVQVKHMCTEFTYIV